MEDSSSFPRPVVRISPSFRTGARLVACLLVCTLTDRIAAQVSWSLFADHPAASTRSLRGIALDPNAARLYGSFIQGSSTAGVRSYTFVGTPPLGTTSGFFNVTTQPFASSASHQAEAVVVDDRGWVYLASIKDSTSADNARVYICTEDFATSTMVALADIDFPGTTGETIGGLDVRNDAGVHQLYVTRFHGGSDAPYVERYVIGGATVATATLTLDPTFNGTGRHAVPGAAKLRGIDVAADGTMFVASRDQNRLWRIPASLTGESFATVTRAMDVALYGANAYVTSYDGLNSAVLEFDAATLTATGRSFTATGVFTRGTSEGYSGIDIDAAGRLYVCDQIYASNSDRILVSSPVCPEDLYADIGTGCSGAGPFLPDIEAAPASIPQAGTTFQADLTGMPSSGGAFAVLLGFRTDVWGSFVLPQDLGIVAMPGCTLYQDVALATGGTQLGGSASYSLPLPGDVGMLGLRFYNQVVVVDPAANAFGLTVSNCKRGCIVP
ncbi:MAG: hypothetical protein IT457_22455 [Planctomycetes bacterium]|nr:hypothetical protein [Planctomycetota bacterium]